MQIINHQLSFINGKRSAGFPHTQPCFRLWLLGSPSDQVRGLGLHGTRPVNPTVFTSQRASRLNQNADYSIHAAAVPPKVADLCESPAGVMQIRSFCPRSRIVPIPLQAVAVEAQACYDGVVRMRRATVKMEPL